LRFALGHSLRHCKRANHPARGAVQRGTAAAPDVKQLRFDALNAVELQRAIASG
jgi:hypothetical protein